MMQTVIAAIKTAFDTEYGATGTSHYYGPIPDEVGLGTDVVSWEILNTDDAQYDSCSIYQIYNVQVKAYSTSMANALDLSRRGWWKIENDGISPGSGSYVKVDKGSELLEQDPDKAENGQAIWASTVLFEIEYYRSRP